MSFLTPDRIRTLSIAGKTLSVLEKIIPDSARSNKDQTSYCKAGDPVKPCRPLGDGAGPRGVCIHNTGDIITAAGTNPAEQYTRAMWPNCNMKGVAVHFFVWHDVIWQSLADTEQGWHAGDGASRPLTNAHGQRVGGNLDTISIECIGRDPESEETTAALAAALLQLHGLGIGDLYTHHDFTPTKYCPAYILPHWDSFRNKVAALLGGSTASASPEETAFFAGEAVQFLGGSHFASANAANPTGTARVPSRARLTRIVAGTRHPYHLIHEGEGNVYGWVDADRVAKLADEAATPAPSPAPAETERPTAPQAPAEAERPAAPETPTEARFPTSAYAGVSLVDALKSVGAQSSFAYRTKIAEANGIADYSGTAAQNLSLLALWRQGKLIKP